MQEKNTKVPPIDGAAFERFRRAYPEIELGIAQLALAEYAVGETHLAIAELWERYRRTAARSGRTVPGMNAAFKPYMVRLIITAHPELDELFERRSAPEADRWWQQHQIRVGRVIPMQRGATRRR